MFQSFYMIGSKNPFRVLLSQYRYENSSKYISTMEKEKNTPRLLRLATINLTNERPAFS